MRSLLSSNPCTSTPKSDATIVRQDTYASKPPEEGSTLPQHSHGTLHGLPQRSDEILAEHSDEPLHGEGAARQEILLAETKPGESTTSRSA